MTFLRSGSCHDFPQTLSTLTFAVYCYFIFVLNFFVLLFLPPLNWCICRVPSSAFGDFPIIFVAQNGLSSRVSSLLRVLYIYYFGLELGFDSFVVSYIILPNAYGN